MSRELPVIFEYKQYLMKLNITQLLSKNWLAVQKKCGLLHLCLTTFVWNILFLWIFNEIFTTNNCWLFALQFIAFSASGFTAGNLYMPSLYIKNNVVGKCKILFQLFMIKQILNSLFLPQQTSVSTTASSSYSPSLFCGFHVLRSLKIVICFIVAINFAVLLVELCRNMISSYLLHSHR
jgi:hypothetical protein